MMKLEDFSKIKTFSGVLKILKHLKLFHFSEFDYNRLFYVTIGTHKNNLFMSIDITRGNITGCDQNRGC